MTDLLHVLPDFPTAEYSHLIPSLEKNLVTTTDLLTLGAVEVAKRAQLPTVDIRRLIKDISAFLRQDLGLDCHQPVRDGGEKPRTGATDTLFKSRGVSLIKKRAVISTLDERLDAALGGGIPTRYITEITGESGAGKTQLVLTTLLSAQLPSPYGLSRPTLYISTEHRLPTTRLQQLINTHPVLAASLPRPSLTRILTLQTPDLETQDHIITYQLPVAVRSHNIGLVVIDSITANYRAEATPIVPHQGSILVQPIASALSGRAADLTRTGALLRRLARRYDCAIIVANQVADRFSTPSHYVSSASQGAMWSSSPIPESGGNPGWSGQGRANNEQELRFGWAVHSALNLDWQLRFFSGWGIEGGRAAGKDEDHPKTPALGLVWANQLACRVALVKEAAWGLGSRDLKDKSAEPILKKWRRWARVAFAPWVEGAGLAERGIEFEIWGGGLKSVEDSVVI